MEINQRTGKLPNVDDTPHLTLAIEVRAITDGTHVAGHEIVCTYVGCGERWPLAKDRELLNGAMFNEAFQHALRPHSECIGDARVGILWNGLAK